jgi:hypothetical protein
MAIGIDRPKIVLVEGQDEVHFVTALLDHMGIAGKFQVTPAGGKDSLAGRLKAIAKDSFVVGGNLEAVCVVRDADHDPDGAFASIQDALRRSSFPVPQQPFTLAGRRPCAVVAIFPDGGREGMLEDLVYQCIADHPCATCVEAYMECLRSTPSCESAIQGAKARIRSYLVKREWLEVSLFDECQQFCREANRPWGQPQAIQRVHAFLASMYKPTLDLGVAAEAGFFPLDHPVFAPLRECLAAL